MPVARKTFESGGIIDSKYRIVRPIGEGGMGEVYEARHVKIGYAVAIKTLRSEYIADDTAIERLHREAQLAGSIGHDHICPVTDMGRHNDIPYLVMPLLAGDTLQDVLASGKLPVTHLMDVIDQVLSALSVAHRMHIVHRDLKPGNVFITTVGKQSIFVKLLDFGISKVLNSETTTLTRHGAVPGTLHYMSPEQAMGAKEIDHRIDLYAVGVILYRALTGGLPFDGESGNEILYRISSCPFVPPRQVNPDIPRALERVVLKAMARDPVKRYQNAEQMRNALNGIDTGDFGRINALIGGDIPLTRSDTESRPEPMTAFGSEPVTVPRLWFLKEKRAMGLTIGMLVFLIAGFVYAFFTVTEPSGTEAVRPVPLSFESRNSDAVEAISENADTGDATGNAESASSTDHSPITNEAFGSREYPPNPERRRFQEGDIKGNFQSNIEQSDTASGDSVGNASEKLKRKSKTRTILKKLQREDMKAAELSESVPERPNSIKGPLGTEISLEYEHGQQ